MANSLQKPFASNKHVQWIGDHNNIIACEKNGAIVWNIGDWKSPAVAMCLAEYKCYFVKKRNNPNAAMLSALPQNVQTQFIWGYSENTKLANYFEKYSVQINRIEDGFIRSTALGSTLSVPLSLAVDNDTLYFDARKPSRLENLFNGFDRHTNFSQINSARIVLNLYKKLKISKYNQHDISYRSILPATTKKRVLVLGQVEDDASIRFGNAEKWNNEKLLSLALEENPEAQIIYKPHPDVLNGYRIGKLKKLKEKFLILTDMVILADLFKEVDHVYTLTSLSGFEALLNDCTVTTIGSPFYSGWGACDDRQAIPRRTKTLTPTELFHVSFIVYPTYLLNIENSLIGCLATLFRVAAERRVNTFLHLSKNSLKANSHKFANSNYWPLLIKHKDLFPSGTVEMVLKNEIEAIQKQYEKFPNVYEFFLNCISNQPEKTPIRISTKFISEEICIQTKLNQNPIDVHSITALVLIACRQQDWRSANLLLRYRNCVAPFLDCGESDFLQAISEAINQNFGESLTCASLACSQNSVFLLYFAKLAPILEKKIGTLPYLSSMQDAWRSATIQRTNPDAPIGPHFQEIYSLLMEAALGQVEIENS